MVKDLIKPLFEQVIRNNDSSKEIKELFFKEIEENEDKCNAFLSSLDEVKSKLKEDLAFYMESDPAVDSEEEVILAYPGYKAIFYHRVAHLLDNLGYKLEARIIAEEAHSLTGIDIHPGATIGTPFFIDHGTGVVIGQTAIIGKYVKIYQGVTLGALSLAKGIRMKGTKRHPTVGDYVTIYSGASILGDVTVGDHVTIGSNVFCTESIPSYTKVTIGKPELIIIERQK